MPVEEFQAYWLRTHPTAVARLPGVRRYVQSHTRLAGYGKGEPIYDGIAEPWFEDTKAMHALRGTKEMEAVTADEAVFIDRATMGLILTEEHVIKDGPVPPRGVKNVEFVTRKPGLAVDEFQRYWREIHGPLAAQIPVTRRRAVHHHHRVRDRPVMKDSRTPVVDALVDFVLGLELGSLPDAVVAAAGLSFTDWVGAAIRGSTEPLAAALDAVVAASGGEPQATVLGRGRRTSALLAALANGAHGHALDFDDTHLASIVHGSAPVAPVVLAIAEWHRRPGAAALEAFVAGFEVETRIGRVIGPMLADRGWHVTAVLGHFGAVVAAGKLLGLTAPQLGRALGIAGTQAAGLEQSLGTMCKPLHPGKAAMNGLLAAQLAREGFTGPAGILDARPGLPGTFLGVTDLSPALDDLGTRFEILDNSTKLYAACHLLHATIDAGRAIRARSAPAPEAIATVECHVHPLAVKVAAIAEPRTGLEAKFSVAYCAALALTGGEAAESEFATTPDPALVELAGRIRPVADLALGIPEARMRVRLRDGRVLDEVVRAARGTPGHPVSRPEVEEKFRRLAGVVLPAGQVGRLLETLRHLPALADVGALAALTCKGDQP